MPTETHDRHAENALVVTSPSQFPTVDCHRFEANAPVAVDHAFDAHHAEVNGPLSVDGPMNVHHCDCNGPLGVMGPLNVHHLDVDGSVGVEGPTSCHELDLDGAGQFADLHAETISVSGALEATDCSAETVSLDGALDCDQLDASHITLRLSGESAVRRIDADELTVTRRQPDGFLVADTITADHLSLEHTEVTTVEGDHVTIGPGCHVQLLRASEYEIDDAATVDEKEAY
ncbi:hypothetical protein [Haloarchaeobius sp. DFWS5]|uniref:hypothetical protein n=1 Tax=Haloarchaeobius sp. DFWS5 TaxID=3446114 RepID=UPI003EB82EAF